MSSFYQYLLGQQYPYIIAEIGANHNGDMELAEKMVLEAKRCGASCVKFQSWTKDSVFSEQVYKDNYFLNDDYRNRDDLTLEEIVLKYQLSERQLLKLKEICDTNQINFASTPFTENEVDFLCDNLDVNFIKIASMDLNNLPFLDYVAKKNKPIVLATGLSSLDEIDVAIRTIEKAGNNEIAVLHCVSNYPPVDSEVNLNNIKSLGRLYPYIVGFSDHSMGTELPLAAIAIGAKVLEKHFTLDKSLEGWDHKVSADPEELKHICCGSRRIIDALGSERIISVETEEKKSAFRRSIVLNKEMSAGDYLNVEDLDFKRPGSGISPYEVKYVIGRRLARDLKYSHILTWQDLV